MCLLKRDDPEDIVKLEGKRLKLVKELLRKDGFYKGEIDNSYDNNTRKALRDWLGTNNFEVKERDDDYMWRSLFRLIEKKMIQ